ncbi:hypothetical protein MRB53_006156 [Persea americana]|uniref:Uncharacterized protein n=1 Tax=Persea americana TaxID=3435 RepID=A0ACC2MFM0_PERAE|nr:hypothetical protein MRB53_006156 [Persea americana]
MALLMSSHNTVERQLSQIVTLLHEKEKGTLPSQPETNPRHQAQIQQGTPPRLNQIPNPQRPGPSDDCHMISALRSGREYQQANVPHSSPVDTPVAPIPVKASSEPPPLGLSDKPEENKEETSDRAYDFPDDIPITFDIDFDSGFQECMEELGGDDDIIFSEIRSIQTSLEPLGPLATSSPKPSIIEAPKLELKELPANLRYAFLGSDQTLPVIIASDLTSGQEEELISLLKENKEALEQNFKQDGREEFQVHTQWSHHASDHRCGPWKNNGSEMKPNTSSHATRRRKFDP